MLIFSLFFKIQRWVCGQIFRSNGKNRCFKKTDMMINHGIIVINEWCHFIENVWNYTHMYFHDSAIHNPRIISLSLASNLVPTRVEISPKISVRGSSSDVKSQNSHPRVGLNLASGTPFWGRTAGSTEVSARAESVKRLAHGPKV